MDSRVASTAADNPAVCSPHLKKVLKSFQMTSMRSLNGPDTRAVYGMGYGLDKECPTLISSFNVLATNNNNNGNGGKTNFISSDGIYYKKRAKSIPPPPPSLPQPQQQQQPPSLPSLNSSVKNDDDLVSGKIICENNCSDSQTTTTTSSTVTVTTSANKNRGGDDEVGTVKSKMNEERNSFENDIFLGPPPFPIQQVPILTAADQGWSESKTLLEGELISCFVVGGEKRLCLPQILNTVLRDFSLPQINAVCDELQIYCSRCNQEQLGVLKMTGILPPSAPSCGLVTKTDCERLCNALLHRYPPRAVHNLPPEKRPLHFHIYHECFGKCEGVYTPDHFSTPDSKCIECSECHGLLSPQKFVGHVHKALENRTCHWGFDSLSWRSYILVGKNQENMNHLKDQLDEMKDRFDGTKNNRKRKPRSGTNNAAAVVIKAEAVEFVDDDQQQQRALADEDELEVKEDATTIKKRKTEITDTYYPYVYDPVACYYSFSPNNPCHPHANSSALSRLSAFRPWSPLLTAAATKEGKFNPNIPLNTVAFARESAPPTFPAYLSRGPPVLLNPERVVPVSETERFERHYQPNVALAPPSAQIQAKQKSPHQTSQNENISSSAGQQQQQQQQQQHRSSVVNQTAGVRPKIPQQQQQIPVTNSKRLPESASASTTLPGQHRGYSDIELSTDTDETFSDSTTYSTSGSPTSSSSRNLVKDGQTLTGEVDVFVTEMKFLRQLLEEEVSDREVRDKVLSKVARMCYSLEQKVEKSELSNRQLQQELEYVKMSKRERLREAAETKRQLRKEMERLYEERISLERQINEMRKDSLSLSSSLQRQIVLKREQTDEDEQEELRRTCVSNEVRIHPNVEDELFEEEDEMNQLEQEQQPLEEEMEDVKPNLGLLVASVSSGY